MAIIKYHMAIIKYHNGSIIELPRHLLPDEIKGDVIKIIVDEAATRKREKNTQNLSFKTFMEIFESKDFINPIKLFRKENGYSRYRFAGLIKSNTTTLKKVEESDCKNTTAFEVIKKIAKQFNDVDEKEMIWKHLEYKSV
jgi:DNA-binding XRE family transcriptional regulator